MDQYGSCVQVVINFLTIQKVLKQKKCPNAFTVEELCKKIETEEDLTEITKWTLKGNKIGDDGVIMIINLALKMSSLKRLNLSSNEITIQKHRTVCTTIT